MGIIYGYQHILEADEDNIENTRDEVKAHVQKDSTLIKDEIIKQFLLYPNNISTLRSRPKLHLH